MIQDIYPHLFNNRFIITNSICDNDYIFYYKDDTLLLKREDDSLVLPRKKDIPDFPDRYDHVFLFTLNNIHCFLVWDNLATHHGTFAYHEVNSFRTFPQKEIAWAGIVGHQLKTWYGQNRFCGKCGSHTQLKQDERAIVCPRCGNIVFPKISPAIIVAILCGDKILLAQGANFRSGFYSLVAGYADVGESLEEALRREVKEEVGIDVTNIRYYTSQPWPFSGSMMIGFVAEADPEQTICIDEKEIAHAAWFTRGNLPNHPPALSIAGEIIDKFERGELQVKTLDLRCE